MTVHPGGEKAWGISSMYINTLWKGVKRWRQTLLHDAQWQAQGVMHVLEVYLIIKRLLVMWLGNHWNRFPRGVVVPMSLDSQNWVGCGPVQSSFDDFVSNWGASWGQVGDRGGKSGLNVQRLSLPTSMIMWNWEQKALLSFSSLSFSCFSNNRSGDERSGVYS